MARGRARRAPRFGPEKIGAFLEAAYDLVSDDQAWLAEVMKGARAVWGREGPAHGIVYDASDVSALRAHNVHTIGFSRQAIGYQRPAFGLREPTDPDNNAQAPVDNAHLPSSSRALASGMCSSFSTVSCRANARFLAYRQVPFDE